MSFGEAARTGKPKSLRLCRKCGLGVSANEEDHKEECVKVIKQSNKQREKQTKKLRKAGSPEHLIRWHRKNWADRDPVTDPVQRRTANPGPKWYEFKVVPLSRDRHYKSLARGTVDGRPKYFCEGDRDKTRRLNARGMEAYVEFDGNSRSCERIRTIATSPTNV